jgi:hypothetical protein
MEKETVIKCSLSALILGEKQKLIPLIERRVLECSKRTHNASVVLNLLIRELFHGKNVSDVVVPHFWEQTFIRQLMLGVDSAQKPIPEIKDFYLRHPDFLQTIKRSPSDRNIYSFAAIKFCTNVKNHLVTNFLKVICKYLKHGLTKEESFEARVRIFGWTIKNKQYKEPLNEERIQEKVKLVRKILELKEGQSIGTLWYKKPKNLANMLKLFVWVNRELELLHEPLFNILPISRIKAHYITLDTSCMTGLLKESKLVKEDLKSDFDLWDSFLDIAKIKGKKQTFTGTIDTDGYSVCVHFYSPVYPQKNVPKEEILKGKRVLGVDPGRTNILTIVEAMDDGSFKEYVLTRKHYYQASGINKANEQVKKWVKHFKNEQNALSRASPKSVSLESFMVYIQTLNEVQETMWKEKFKRYWRAQELRLYGGKKRVFANFLNALKIDKNTVFAYGQAKFAPGGKGEKSVPTSRAYKECASRAKTTMVDEYGTSKVNYKDNTILEKVQIRKNGRLVDVRGLLWCSSTIEGKFVSRDKNAAINILNCAILPTRPIMLRRSHGRYDQRVGKIINR